MFKIPNSSKFNAWSRSEQAMLIDSETEGHLSQHGFLVYEEMDCIIEYTRARNGELKSAFATSLKEGMEKLKKFTLTHGIMRNKN